LEEAQLQMEMVHLNCRIFQHATLTISYVGFESRQFSANELFSAQNNCKFVLPTKMKKSGFDSSISNVRVTKYLDGSRFNTKKFGILPGLIEPDIQFKLPGGKYQ
jgi:hypothetical protein